MVTPETNNEVQAREDFHAEVKRIVDNYLDFFPNEEASLTELIKNLGNKALDLRHRTTIPAGHMTASGILVSDDKTHVLMQGHKSLAMPVVPGGHYDDDDIHLSETALREALEETGVQGLRLHSWHQEHDGIPLDINIHPIPANPRKGEGAHQHFEFRYVLVANKGYDASYAYAKANFDANEVTDVYSVPIRGHVFDASISQAIAKIEHGKQIGL
jgi:8-oxo-dGTP pyrophosphatase MutT (NUDIX family)